MSPESTKDISIDAVREIVAEKGYEVVNQDENALNIRDLETGVIVTLALENDVLFNTVSCATVPQSSLGTDVMQTMLDAENGISTSSFQVYKVSDEKVSITLNNLCKLQAMGEDDKDDILSCISFLIVDTFAARELLRNLIK